MNFSRYFELKLCDLIGSHFHLAIIQTNIIVHWISIEISNCVIRSVTIKTSIGQLAKEYMTYIICIHVRFLYIFASSSSSLSSSSFSSSFCSFLPNYSPSSLISNVIDEPFIAVVLTRLKTKITVINYRTVNRQCWTFQPIC